MNIKEFWDKQAQEHKDGIEATTPDRYLRELEINAINAELKEKGDLLDIGCGNGYSTVRFKEKHPKLDITGMDFSKEMLSYAPDCGIAWVQGDVRHTGLPDESFSQVTTDRCLINLETENDQLDALREIHRVLRDGGRYLMCENWISGLEELNKWRVLVDLPRIEVRWHNRYLSELVACEMLRLFKLEKIVPFASTYYMCSRILNARLSADAKTEPKYDSRINEIAKVLPAMGNLGPMKLYVLRKA